MKELVQRILNLWRRARVRRLIGVVPVLALALLATVPFMTGARAVPRQADAYYGGVVYTDTGTLGSQYVATWDYFNVHAAVEISGTGTITVTPQFSGQGGTCAAATDWYTPTAYLRTTSGGVVKTPLYFTASGSSINAARSVPITGRCARVRIACDPGCTYTPTVYTRVYLLEFLLDY